MLVLLRLQFPTIDRNNNVINDLLVLRVPLCSVNMHSCFKLFKKIFRFKQDIQFASYN